MFPDRREHKTTNPPQNTSENSKITGKKQQKNRDNGSFNAKWYSAARPPTPLPVKDGSLPANISENGQQNPGRPTYKIATIPLPGAQPVGGIAPRNFQTIA